MAEEADFITSRMLGEGPRRRHRPVRRSDLTKVHYHRQKAQTEDALLLDVKNVGEMWVPRSIIEHQSAHTVMLHSSVWRQMLAHQKGLVNMLPDLDEGDDDAI